jgi:primosomal protein N' (replication factor Y)
MNPPASILRVAINTPVNKLFDYLPPAKGPTPKPGKRVSVPFGRRKLIGVIAAVTTASEFPLHKLKRAEAVLDEQVLLEQPLVNLLNWAARYYQHPPGEVFAAALPTPLRQGAAAVIEKVYRWAITGDGRAVDTEQLARRAKVQAEFLHALKITGHCEAATLRDVNTGWRKTMATFEDKGWVRVEEISPQNVAAKTSAPPSLTEAQQEAIAGVPAENFNACLLEGVTGSGKTEVYLQLIEQQLKAGRQSLVLVPEIGLTPQLLQRFEQRLGIPMAVLHSNLTDTQRTNNWIRAMRGEAQVIIGTRSAIFASLPRPGLIVIDEEHDASFKQQDGFRYSARDLAVYRARQLDIPVVLGSATPALESLHNALSGRYIHLHLPERPGSARQPQINIVDLRKYPLTEGLSQPLLASLRKHLDAGDQALIYLNRRGFAPTLLCPTCGTTAECRRCDARMVLHQNRNRLICHHCGSERPLTMECNECNSELVAVGLGTERLEQKLTEAFPEYPLVRIDRDTTRKRGELERLLESVRTKQARILLGTQMLTKGHDFPDVTCVGIIDSDQGLFGTDFRSGERLAQSILQVSGRAGRGDKPGEVWLQTWYPEHPLLNTLLHEGYSAFASQALAERDQAAWPPFTHLALIRSECAKREVMFRFLEQAKNAALGISASGVSILGPASSPMERRGGRYRGQLLIHAADRGQLQRFLPALRATIEQLDDARRTRWSIDVDPIELF